MKQIYLLPFILMLYTLSSAQITNNQSDDGVDPSITIPIGQQFTGQSPQPSFPIAPEIFRFKPGLVTQLDAFVPPSDPDDTFFSFDDSRWFSIGRLQTSPNQTVYGLRFQLPNRALTFGYQDIGDDNPRIQWIDDRNDPGNLEFRVADDFMSTNSTLVATMTSDGRTVFGVPQLLSTSDSKVYITNSGSGESKSLSVRCDDVTSGIGLGTAISGFAVNGNQSNIGVKGSVTTRSSNFGYGINGSGQPSTTSDIYAGYFNGNVGITGTVSFLSDRALKENLEISENALENISQLNAYSFTYKANDDVNLPLGLQTGFIAQEVEKVYPELVKEMTYPIYDEEGQLKDTGTYKSVNYIGIISELTAAIKELNAKVEELENQVEPQVVYSSKFTAGELEKITKNAYKLEQNIPNPFTQSTLISYALPEDNTKASILVFDLNGRMLKSYDLKENNGKLKINATDLNGSGMYLYTLFANGQEIITKRMILK